MRIRCEAEELFPGIEKLIKKLSDGNTLGEDDGSRLRELLNKYWSIEKCPFDECLPNRCSYANPETWIKYHGYTSMGDLLAYFKYDGIEILELKDNKKSIGPWGRRPGNYSP